MLVLTRKTDQAIHIGGDVKITVVDVRGDKVRIGIEAPREVAVHREEIFRQIGDRLLRSEADLPPEHDHEPAHDDEEENTPPRPAA